MNIPEIKKVDRGTDLADKLICFVENFSWEDVKAVSYTHLTLPTKA